MKLKKQLVVLLSSFLFAIGGIALAAGPNWVNSGQVIYACVTGVNGNITKVSNVDHSCPRGSTPIYWNQQGLKGDPGAVGQTGATGPAGPVNTSNGLVPWYLANAQGNPVAVPLSPSVMPSGPDGSTQVMLSGMIATVDYVTGTVRSAAEVGDLAVVFFTSSDCTTGAMGKNALARRYMELSDGSQAFTADGNSYSLNEAHSTNNPAMIKTMVAERMAQWQGGGEVISTDFKTLSAGPGCRSFTTANLENYASVQYSLNRVLPEEATQGEIDSWDTGRLNFITQVGLDYFVGLTSVDVIPDFGPLQFVSNY